MLYFNLVSVELQHDLSFNFKGLNDSCKKKKLSIISPQISKLNAPFES